VLLGLFPLLAKKIVGPCKARKVYARWADREAQAFRPQPGGHWRRRGGLVTAYIAAAVKAKVTLVEATRWAATA
jgi:hypothetical protein